eukprot:TRINITY_DN11880_c0_g1_i1.p1 TRINITY_DN11880_c0_g1~~TRINITY_DN11880_c0_g1_i1.p1  ORF type:complete len:287 (-),score=69.55 TRINITY_DN11880_c0_g1_i1:449-1309(-)
MGVIIKEASWGFSFTASSANGAGAAAIVIILIYLCASLFLTYFIRSPYPKSAYWWVKIETCSVLFGVSVIAFVWISLVSLSKYQDALHCLNVAVALLESWYIGSTIYASFMKTTGNLFVPNRLTHSKSLSVRDVKITELRMKYKEGISLEEALEDKEIAIRYRTFLDLEFASDLLAFYIDVKSFKESNHNAPDSKFVEGISTLYEKYLVKGAPHDISPYILTETFSDLQKKCVPNQNRKKSAEDAIGVAFKEVSRRMDHDSFKRFLRSLKIKHNEGTYEESKTGEV